MKNKMMKNEKTRKEKHNTFKTPRIEKMKKHEEREVKHRQATQTEKMKKEKHNIVDHFDKPSTVGNTAWVSCGGGTSLQPTVLFTSSTTVSGGKDAFASCQDINRSSPAFPTGSNLPVTQHLQRPTSARRRGTRDSSKPAIAISLQPTVLVTLPLSPTREICKGLESCVGVW